VQVLKIQNNQNLNKRIILRDKRQVILLGKSPNKILYYCTIVYSIVDVEKATTHNMILTNTHLATFLCLWSCHIHAYILRYTSCYWYYIIPYMVYVDICLGISRTVRLMSTAYYTSTQGSCRQYIYIYIYIWKPNWHRSIMHGRIRFKM